MSRRDKIIQAFLRVSHFKTKARCGHKTRVRGKIYYTDDEYIDITLLIVNGKPNFCLDCMKKHMIRCAWCGEPILISDSITLYSPGENYEMPDYAVIHRQDPLQLVGCGRRTCADIADYCGTWTLEGVHRDQSLIEIAIDSMSQP